MIARIGSELFPHLDISIEKDRDRAFEKALEGDGSVLITGSFYLASVMRRIREMEGL